MGIFVLTIVSLLSGRSPVPLGEARHVSRHPRGQHGDRREGAAGRVMFPHSMRGRIAILAAALVAVAVVVVVLTSGGGGNNALKELTAKRPCTNSRRSPAPPASTGRTANGSRQTSGAVVVHVVVHELPPLPRAIRPRARAGRRAHPLPAPPGPRTASPIETAPPGAEEPARQRQAARPLLRLSAVLGAERRPRRTARRRRQLLPGRGR